MDERYSPYYMEDVDLSVRAWRMGWKCYYEEDAVCYHKLSETISKHSSKKHVSYISKRNKFIFHALHLEGGKRMLWKTENAMNLLTRWIALDTEYYRSYSAYKKVTRKENTRVNFPKTLEEAVSEILRNADNIEKKLF